jgi:hypothetical protein
MILRFVFTDLPKCGTQLLLTLLLMLMRWAIKSWQIARKNTLRYTRAHS